MQRCAGCVVARDFPVPLLYLRRSSVRIVHRFVAKTDGGLHEPHARKCRPAGKRSWMRHTGKDKAKCMPSCAWMRREGANGSARIEPSYVLFAGRATAHGAQKRALLQSFRDALSREPDRPVVTVNCGTAVRPPRNMLAETAFCVRYQAGGARKPVGLAAGRAEELYFRAWRDE